MIGNQCVRYVSKGTLFKALNNTAPYKFCQYFIGPPFSGTCGSNLSKELKNNTELEVGQGVVKLLIKTIF